ncbi:ImmA/IrrE family metallo-endopeptidase [Geomonas terrae]|uniref:ImmA/IrrE family metallo-endopeptidase n=1 Tax=Geomonas terrae TaxID=2562681 RepID=A0A4S1CCS1_9BACT|nr:XRE family transcriptional regulator [Geomonas terrae]TGU71179.1 ImmA/IrrE family metallo-endopeptidase [Geomonas terrae]
MAIDLKLLSTKLIHMRESHDLSVNDVSSRTGIPLQRVAGFESAELEPNGDEVLIISDLYSCDYKYFISNEKFASIDKADQLFRMLGNSVSPEDKLSISQFLMLCENEHMLSSLLSLGSGGMPALPSHIAHDKFYKRQGQHAAMHFRKSMALNDLAIVPDVYSLVRDLGVHIFRRKLSNSNVSGIFLNHPEIGLCILVNYEDDVFRQRFTVMHELGHAVFDSDLEYVISGNASKWSTDKLREIRADNFAATFLCPSVMVERIPDPARWSSEKVVDFASRLRVSASALAIALENNGLIDERTTEFIKSVRIPAELKLDPELEGLESPARERKLRMLELGLSSTYVKLSIDCYYHNLISIGCLADMLLVDQSELADIAELYKFRL